jgi:hypothetical protein
MISENLLWIVVVVTLRNTVRGLPIQNLARSIRYLWLSFQCVARVVPHKTFDNLALVFRGTTQKLPTNAWERQDALELMGFGIDSFSKQIQRWCFRLPQTATNKTCSWGNLYIVSCVRAFAAGSAPSCGKVRFVRCLIFASKKAVSVGDMGREPSSSLT